MLTGRLERREPHRVATQHLDSTPAARPFAAIDAVPLLDWDTIDRVLRSERPLDVLTVAAGERVLTGGSDDKLSDVTARSEGVLSLEADTPVGVCKKGGKLGAPSS